MGLRQQRVADEIRDIIAGCFSGGQLSDPRLEYVTITAVKLSADLQVASVYFRTMKTGLVADNEKIIDALNHATGYFKRILAKQLEMRRLPHLRFFYDASVENGAHIEALLAGIR